MTPTKVRSAAYRARKKVRDSDALVRLERYERALREIAALGVPLTAEEGLNIWRIAFYAVGGRP